MKSPNKILIIEDERIVRKALSRILTTAGYEVIEAATLSAGFKACVTEIPDLVLLDVNLPDGNGIELCAKIKADEQLQHTPILIMTGEATSANNRIDGLDAGAEDYLLKPFPPKDLLFRVENILKTHAEAAAAKGPA